MDFSPEIMQGVAQKQFNGEQIVFSTIDARAILDIHMNRHFTEDYTDDK